jgi:cardiolipin synthase
MRSLRLWAFGPCLLLSACARLPDLNHLKAPVQSPANPSVVNSQGRMTSKAAAALLARRLGPSNRDAAVMLAGLEEAATGRPLIAGNKVTLLFDGPVIMAAMMEAISAAKETINLETYLFDQDPLGTKFADLLIAKQKEGVQVSIIYDSVGTLGTPQGFFDRMQQKCLIPVIGMILYFLMGKKAKTS